MSRTASSTKPFAWDFERHLEVREAWLLLLGRFVGARQLKPVADFV